MWNYRAIKDKDGSVCLHEVYYNDDGSIMSWTVNPVAFASIHSVDDLVQGLEMAISDLKKYPILNITDLEEQFFKEK